MANATYKYEDNMGGPFYVDMECIACDTCRMVAPKHFKLTSDFSHAIVFNQPRNAEEILSCQEALDACPVDAIGYER